MRPLVRTRAVWFVHPTAWQLQQQHHIQWIFKGHTAYTSIHLRRSKYFDPIQKNAKRKRNSSSCMLTFLLHSLEDEVRCSEVRRVWRFNQMTCSRVRQHRQQVSISCFLHHHLHLSVKDPYQGSNSDKRISVIAGENTTPRLTAVNNLKGQVTQKWKVSHLLTLVLL